MLQKLFRLHYLTIIALVKGEKMIGKDRSKTMILSFHSFALPLFSWGNPIDSAFPNARVRIDESFGFSVFFFHGRAKTLTQGVSSEAPPFLCPAQNMKRRLWNSFRCKKGKETAAGLFRNLFNKNKKNLKKWNIQEDSPWRTQQTIRF